MEPTLPVVYGVPGSLYRYTRCSALEKGSKRVRDVGARGNRDSVLSAQRWCVDGLYSNASERLRV